MLSNINPDSLHSVQGDEFLPSISSWITLGGGVMVITFSGAVALAAVLNYNVTVKAPANIRPAGELQVVQAATEGLIKSIEAKENQVVRKGDLIAYIDDSQLQTKKIQLQGNIQQSRLQLIQIAAQLNSLATQTAAETRLMNRTIAASQAGVLLQQRDYQDKQLTARSEVEEAAAALELAREEMKRYQQLANTGTIPKLQVKEKEQTFKVALARLRRAQASLNPSNAAVVMATEQIAQEKAKGLATIATLNKERENLESTQVEAQNQLSRDLKELQQIEIELGKAFIIAPTDGTILQLELRNAGQVVSTGQAIAQIAPSHTPLVVKAHVASQDINQVRPGQKMQMRVSACPYSDYGTLKGTVTTVAPDTLPATRSGVNTSEPQPFYEVIIQPQTPFVGDGDRQCQLQAGMEGRADIISREETVLQFILRKAKLLTQL